MRIPSSHGSAFTFFSGGGEVEVADLVVDVLGVNHFLRVFCLLFTSNLHRHTRARAHTHTHTLVQWCLSIMYIFIIVHILWALQRLHLCATGPQFVCMYVHVSVYACNYSMQAVGSSLWVYLLHAFRRLVLHLVDQG